MLSNFFRINLPYGIRGNSKKGWMAFNREYKPLGFKNWAFEDRVKYECFPIFAKYQSLTENKLKKISHNGEIQKEGEDLIVFLYNDSSNPSNNFHKTDWITYFEKLKILSQLKNKD